MQNAGAAIAFVVFIILLLIFLYAFQNNPRGCDWTWFLVLIIFLIIIGLIYWSYCP